ncbi:hypothetical protein, conserved in T. vivax [Trypanosoma vivax Y486]|uniref:Uncharacterized protein n=1 Tax=Trypanosoma vivax (strain Y486) TaxID=1055687 RepID=F9WP04_TRYVY|nr:hypothetical protein, conserved in T. vivax [Trypanosoma vivax Y486]|eukprot:CCD19277.1 hypothetical protein, conserved in T. vivax [Trypanosoma vivax Y486]
MPASTYFAFVLVLSTFCYGAVAGNLRRSGSRSDVSCKFPNSADALRDGLYNETEDIVCEFGAYVGTAVVVFNVLDQLAQAAKNWELWQNESAREVIENTSKAATAAKQTVHFLSGSTAHMFFEHSTYFYIIQYLNKLKVKYTNCKNDAEKYAESLRYEPAGGGYRRSIFAQGKEMYDLWRLALENMTKTHEKIGALKMNFYLCRFVRPVGEDLKYTGFYNFMTVLEKEFETRLMKLSGNVLPRRGMFREASGENVDMLTSKLMNRLQEEEKARLKEAEEPIRQLIENRNKTRRLCAVANAINNLNTTASTIFAYVNDVFAKLAAVGAVQRETSRLAERLRERSQRTAVLAARVAANGASADSFGGSLIREATAMNDPEVVENVQAVRGAVSHSKDAAREGMEAVKEAARVSATANNAIASAAWNSSDVRRLESEALNTEKKVGYIIVQLSLAGEAVGREIVNVSSSVEAIKKTIREIQEKFPITVAELDGDGVGKSCDEFASSIEMHDNNKTQLKTTGDPMNVHEMLGKVQEEINVAKTTVSEHKKQVTEALSAVEATMVTVGKANEAAHSAESKAMNALDEVRNAKAAIKRAAMEVDEIKRRSTNCTPLYVQFLRRIVLS